MTRCKRKNHIVCRSGRCRNSWHWRQQTVRARAIAKVVPREVVVVRVVSTVVMGVGRVVKVMVTGIGFEVTVSQLQPG